MEHATSYIIHIDRNLPSYAHFEFTLDGRERLYFLSIKSLENIPCPIFAAKSPLSSSSKLLNLWYDILTLSHVSLNDLFSLSITLCIDAEK